MKIVYIAGQYRADHPYQIWRNIELARELAIQVWQLGHVALCPHTNSMFFEGAASPKAFLEGTLELMRRCDAVLLVPNWTESEGARGEVTEAKKLKIPVFDSILQLIEWLN